MPLHTCISQTHIKGKKLDTRNYLCGSIHRKFMNLGVRGKDSNSFGKEAG